MRMLDRALAKPQQKVRLQPMNLLKRGLMYLGLLGGHLEKTMTIKYPRPSKRLLITSMSWHSRILYRKKTKAA